MKDNINHFEVTKQDFEQLKKNKLIPPQMQTKLQYLLARLQKRPPIAVTSESLPQYQKNSLDELNMETGVSLFCNIVNCLSGKEVVLYFRDEKAYLRKDKLLTMWSKVYIACDSNNIYIRKKIGQKPIEQFDIELLRISKNFKMYKKKHVFGACYAKKYNYLIGFDLESTCARLHELFRNLIREKIRRIEKKPTIQGEVSQISQSKCLEQPLNSQIAKQQQTYQYQQVEQDEQADEDTDKGVVVQFIKQQQINGDSIYRLLKTDNNIRYLVNKNYPNKLKTEIILPKPKTATSIFDYYIKMNEWNPQIQETSIKIKLEDNSYLLQIRVKKYSYLSWARCSVILATALVYKNNYFLVLRSTGEDSSYTDTVKMEWNQIIEIAESSEKVLMSIVSQFDFKGYSSLEDSQRMGLKVLDNLPLFCKFYEAKQISSKSPAVFNLSLAKKPRTKTLKKPLSTDMKFQDSNMVQEDSKVQSQKKIRKPSSNSQFEVPDDESKQQKSESNVLSESKVFQNENNGTIDNSVNDPASFTIYMMRNDDSEISMQLVEAIRKKVHERYYLRQKFDQEVHLDIHKNEHTVEGPNHYIYQQNSWKLNDNQDLVFVNQKVIDIQKDVIKMIIKQLSSNIMSGKSIMNMSLPVQIFDHRSMLERIAKGFGYAAKFLIPASETEDLIQQIKYVTLFILGIGSLHLALTKPFNPILGQTFECKIGGIPLYMQQVSHHPPISAFLMKNQNFSFHGAFHSHAQMGLNRVTGKNLNPIYVEFNNTKTFYQIKLPQMEVCGLLHGDRKYRGIGKGFIHQRTNNKFVQWSIGKDKKKVYQTEGKIKSNDVYGGIYTVAPGFGKKFKQCQNKLKFEGLKSDDIIETHVKITGHWCFDIFFDGQKVRSVQNPLPNNIQYPQYVLPSDSNFRLDLIYKRMQQLKISNQQKQILQNIQRHDRKLREGKIKPK